MFKKNQKLLPAANAAVAVISDDMSAVTAPKRAVRRAAKKAAKRRKSMAGDRVAQVVTVLATIMAAAYIVIRIFNWIRFI